MSTELQLRKEKLNKELKELAKLEQKEIIETHYPEIKKRFEGKFFKSVNSYGSDSKKWNVYTKITGIKPEDVYDTRGNGITSHFTGYSFQVSPQNMIIIEPVTYGYVHSLERQITEKDFNEAWNKMVGKINSFS